MKKMIESIINRKDYKPFAFKDFCYIFAVSKAQGKKQLQNTLDELVSENVLVKVDGKYYRSADVIETTTNKANGVRNKDVKNTPNTRKAKDEVFVVGRFMKCRNFGFVEISRNEADIYIPKKFARTASDMDLVEVKITKQAKPYSKAEGIITKIIAKYNDENLGIKKLYYDYALSDNFSDEVENEAKKLLELNSSKAKEDRKDLRDKKIFTIDGISARDLDDAVAIEKLDSGYMIYVCIADVSYYVRENSFIDKEAYKRGTSVYFPDRAIPMLPRTLCENLCSLNANEDKMSLAIQIEVDFEGKVLDYELYRAIINSKQRMVYDEVNKFLVDGNLEVYPSFQDELTMMNELAKVLYERRTREGSVDLDIDEAEILVDESGKVVDISVRQRGPAEKLIEEFMLLANRCTAEFIYHTSTTSIYRTHEEPDKEKLNAFRMMSSTMGYKIRLPKSHYSGVLNEFVKSMRGKDEEYIIKRMLLRCMKKAEYTTNDTSHFALGFEYYTHFTSPIRRYPDLMVHRIITKLLDGTMDEKYLNFLQSSLQEIATECSKNEVRAEQADRVAEKIFMAKYMKRYVGEVFSGVVCSVTSFGLFIQMSNYCEGLVRYAEMNDDFYDEDASNFRAVGRRKGKIYRLGQSVKVLIESVRCDNGEITLSLYNDNKDSSNENMK